MADYIQYHTTRLRERYGVTVTNLTKAEASELLEAAAIVQCRRNGGQMSASEHCEIETPRVIGERLVDVFMVLGFLVLMYGGVAFITLGAALSDPLGALYVFGGCLVMCAIVECFARST
jgi:hypothetical protein